MSASEWVPSAEASHSSGEAHRASSEAVAATAPVLGTPLASNVPVVAANQFVSVDITLTFAGAPAGHYTLVLSQDGNNPLGQLADGFSMTGQPHYTAQYAGFPDDPAFTFVRIDGVRRSGEWALDLSAPGALAAVPEPSGAALLAAGLAVVWLARRRHRG